MTAPSPAPSPAADAVPAPTAPTAPAGGASCPRCGAERIAGAAFCEACAFAFTEPVAGPVGPGVSAHGEESPLDVGWTGAVVPEGRLA
ncbi:MAG: hypothetical protein ABIW80_10100, partial [Lapillicoccus sp.]